MVPGLRCRAITTACNVGAVRGCESGHPHPAVQHSWPAQYVWVNEGPPCGGAALNPPSRCEGPTFELPGEAAAREGLAAVAGTVPALCQPRTGQRNRGPNFPNSSTSVPLRINGINIQTVSPASASEQCEYPAALCPSGGSPRL